MLSVADTAAVDAVADEVTTYSGGLSLDTMSTFLLNLLRICSLHATHC